jgi:tetratricopeptide (TPR) repeat protein
VRAQVLNDPALAKHAGRFAWLSINAEDAQNAAFVEKVPLDGFPTFLVIDPATEQVALRWYGSLTGAQFERLLDDGERAVAAGGPGPAETALAQADRLQAERKAAEAARKYEDAIRLAPTGWTRRGRAVESLIFALMRAGDFEACAATAQKEAPGLERGPSFANAATSGLSCALDAPKEAPWRAGALAALEPLVKESLSLDSVLADDRSSAYEMLRGAREDRGDEAGAREVAAAWLLFLETEAGKARDPETRAAFDSHRVAAALALGDPGRAVPALLASERDLPDDYNPPARLAVLYRELAKYDEAIAAADRALARAYGPRKLRIYDTKSQIYDRMGDAAKAKRTLEEGLRFAEGLPASQQPVRLVEQLRKKLAAGG